MKSPLVLSLLTVFTIATAVTSYGQGSVQFQNNNFSTVNAPVTFGVTSTELGRHGTAGQTVGSDFKADLLYSLDGGATFILLTAAASQDASYPASFGIPGATDNDSANFAGYFFGGTATIPGYTSGPITFIVEAWGGGSFYNSPNSYWHGQSAPFTLPSIQQAGLPGLPTDFTTMQAFSVFPIVPEPSIFALSGIGAAAFMLIRRKN